MLPGPQRSVRVWLYQTIHIRPKPPHSIHFGQMQPFQSYAASYAYVEYLTKV